MLQRPEFLAQVVTNTDSRQVEAHYHSHQQEGGGIDQGPRRLDVRALEADVIDVEAQVHELALHVQVREVAVHRQRGSKLHHPHQHQRRHLARRTGKPFWGVVPMLENLRLPEEDSVSFKLGITPGLSMGQGRAADAEALDMVVPDLPHISNATDLDALRQEPGLRLRIVRSGEDWGHPHVVIVPGSRNTVADLRFLRATGLADAITRFARTALEDKRGALVGICGGLQMLGSVIDDPLGLEEGGLERGLGILPLKTCLEADKKLLRVTGRACVCLTANPPEQSIGSAAAPEPAETAACLPREAAATGVSSNQA